ncbi:MAG: hypothetical protein R6U28_11370 [Cyclonatronaceae bacterium]
MSKEYWPVISLKDGDVRGHRIGPLTIHLKKLLNEIWVTSSRDDRFSNDPQELPEKPQWTRMALPGEFSDYRITPVLPDKPVVIDTEHAYRFVNRTRTRIYSRVPTFARITASDRDDLIIAEIPTVELSETWFGIFTEGELAYALSTTARRVLTDDLMEPHLVVCPIDIWNKSDEELKFEKICLRVERLSVYAAGKALWADPTLITYHGRDTETGMEMQGAPPAEAEGSKLMNAPRVPIRKSLGLKTFRLLKDFQIPGF